MHRFKSQGVSTRVFPKPQWMNPKEKIVHWNIVTGDKVKNPFISVYYTLEKLT
jgi:hypothetical protein